MVRNNVCTYPQEIAEIVKLLKAVGVPPDVVVVINVGVGFAPPAPELVLIPNWPKLLGPQE